MTYQTPEIMEIGQAEEMTLGFTAKAVPDGCDCTKDGATDVEAKVG
jgi:hypothetical protein